MPVNHNPVYNLKAALKDTGIKPDVLRAWERRYGLPIPKRSAGGQRLYSSYDLAVIKWLMARQAEGLSISHAVGLWNEYLEGGRDPLVEIPGDRPAAMLASDQPAVSSVLQSSIVALRISWLSACLQYNETSADQVLNQAFAMYPVERVCTEIIRSGLAEIGELWYQNRASVQQEHFATGLALRRLDSLLTASPPPMHNRTILVGCPPNELHTFAPMMITLFLRRAGLNVVYLGANVPSARFEETISTVNADLVVLASQQLTTAATLQQVAQILSSHAVKVAFGGRIFNQHPGLKLHIPGHYLGQRLEDTVEMVNQLLDAPVVSPEVIPPDPETQEALQAYNARRMHVEIAVAGSLRSDNDWLNYIATANLFLGNNIQASLTLGKIDFLDAEIEWLKAYLRNLNLAELVLFDYLVAYCDALRENLGPAGAPITGWLDGQIRKLEYYNE